MRVSIFSHGELRFKATNKNIVIPGAQRAGSGRVWGGGVGLGVRVHDVFRALETQRGSQ